MATVTVPGRYLETLLRRAELHVTHEDTGDDTRRSSHVSITKQEHETLLQYSREYACLRTALVNGGVPLETLSLLTKSLPDQPAPAESRPKWQRHSRTTLKPPRRSDWSAEAPVFVPQAYHKSILNVNSSHNSSHNIPHSISHNESVTPSPDAYSYEDEETSLTSERNPVGLKVDQKQSRAFDRPFGQCTLVIKGLPGKATLLDVVKVIRGGRLLNAYIRPREKLGRISFVDTDAALAFLNYSKRAGIFILGKRVDIFNERQFSMPGHLCHKISRLGATRNLVVRQAKEEMTKQSITDDLEHIHNLQVVDINVIHGEAYISLNSVHNAITARACMQSRLKYKACSIEFYPDECDQPLPDLQKKAAGKFDPPKAKAARLGVNRFEMLADDEYDDEDDNEVMDDQVQEHQGVSRGFAALGLKNVNT